MLATGIASCKARIASGLNVWSSQNRVGFGTNPNHLTSATEKDAGGNTLTAVTYTYDALGNRISETVTDGGGNTSTTQFAYDPSGQLVAEMADSGQWTSYLANPQETNDFLARVDSNGVTWLLTDHQGSVTVALSADGSQTVAQATYDAFGNVTLVSGTAADLGRLGFQGGMMDSATGLVHFGARDCDPATGRWTTADPANADINTYRGMGNSPTNEGDPSGEAPAGTAAKRAVLAPAVKKVVKSIIEKLVSKGYLQEHHIIPQKFFNPSRALGAWLLKLADKDAAANMIFLPTLKGGGKAAAAAAAKRIAEGKPVTAAERALAAYAKRTGHQGRHLKAYFADIEQRLLGIMERHVAGHIDDAAARAEIAALQQEVRLGLESGYIILQSAELASLAHTGTLSLGGLGIAMAMSEKAYETKIAKLQNYIENMINGGFTKGMSVEDYFPGAPWAKALDWLNPLDIYRTGDKMGRALAIQSDPKIQAHLEDVARYLGLAPSKERTDARSRAISIIAEAIRNKRGFTQEEADFLKKNNHHLGGLPPIRIVSGDGSSVVLQPGPPEERDHE
jgi:RHS repeat-associated protein